MPHSSTVPCEADSPEQRLRNEARALGFDTVGVADAEAPWPAAARLARFIALDRHGDMAWMAETQARRAHPRALWPSARRAVMVGMNYGPARDPMAALAVTDRAAISAYAQGSDYHDLIKRRLKRLAGWMAETFDAEVKVFVDTAPLMEKPLAERAGVGWGGKHTNLVSREHGSWLFLGAVLTDAVLDPDPPEGDHCGVCRRCLDVCPTDAFPAPYELDARRCLAYLTIEHAGPIPRPFRVAMGNRVFGCDDCLAVCPWNKFAARAREAALQPRAELTAPRLVELAALDDAGFRAVFAGSPVKRTGRDRFIRNVLIALGNVAGPARGEALAAAERLLQDPAPVVRGAAVWAVWRLADPDRFAASAAAHHGAEADPDVQGEWAACSALSTPAAA